MFKFFNRFSIGIKKGQQGLERAVSEGLISQEEKLKIEIERATKQLQEIEGKKEKKKKK